MSAINTPPFSVLIAVYEKETPLFLEEALKSVIDQKLPPDEIVLVKDGPLTIELDSIIEKFRVAHPYFINIVELKQNSGLGIALARGLLMCKHDWVARMDSDDISMEERFTKQLDFIKNHPEYDVVGSNIFEFGDNLNYANTIRKVPEMDEQIKSMAKFRNPINHMTIMFRKKSVLMAGNYQDKRYFEDYDLWVRMIQQGYRFFNIQESLLKVRTGNYMIQKRHGLAYARLEFNFFSGLYKSGFLSFQNFLLISILRIPLRLMPKNILSLVYSKFLRTSK